METVRANEKRRSARASKTSEEEVREEREQLTRIQNLQKLVVRSFGSDAGKEQIRVPHAVPRSSVLHLVVALRHSRRVGVSMGDGVGVGRSGGGESFESEAETGELTNFIDVDETGFGFEDGSGFDVGFGGGEVETSGDGSWVDEGELLGSFET